MANYTGTSGNDSYWGGTEADRIEGLGGRDYLNGNDGNDEIFGGDGDDNLNGGAGDDLIEGGPGNDLLQGEEGVDILRGQAGDDRLYLSASNYGGIAGDSIDGGDGVDTLLFGGTSLVAPIVFSLADPAVAQNLAGATIVNVDRTSFTGGRGNDDITGGAFDDYIDGFDGNDRIDGGPGNDTLLGGGGKDTIYGGGGNDAIYGSVDNMLYGGDGDDSFRWAGDALIDGGAGNDKLTAEYNYYGPNPPGIIVDLSNPNVETLVLGTRVTGIEQLFFTSGAGDDRLTGGVGDDSLSGNEGNDILIGGFGNDTLSGGNGNDQLSGGAGDDRLANYTSDPSPADVIDGGDGFDQLDFFLQGSNASVTIDLLSTTGMVVNVEAIFFSSLNQSGVQNVSGGAVRDTIMGGSGGDYINGRGGDDDLRGEGGDDVILGGGGNDFITGDLGANWLEGGDGDDFVRGSGHIDGGAGDDALIGGESIDILIGGAGSDTLEGWGGADIFVYDQFSDSTAAAPDRIADFLSGTDKIDLRALGPLTLTWQAATDPVTGTYQQVTATSSSGTLTLRVDSPSGLQSTDFLTFQGATEGDDNLVGTDGDDVIDALGGNDRIDGLLGADDLTGGAGNDQIFGGGGNDKLRGGAGSDSLHVSGVGTVLADGGADFDQLTVDYGDDIVGVSMIFPNADPNGGLKSTISNGNGRRIDFSSINLLHITTGSGNDVIYGGENGSSASLGGGDDRFWGAGGYANADGGAGVDGVSADFRLATGAIAWNLQANSFSGPNGSYTNFEYFLEIFTGAAADTVVTTAAALNDTVQLGGGDDALTVINGYDLANGQAGNDLLIIDYGAAAASVVTLGGSLTAGFDPGDSAGRIGDGGSRRVDFAGFERFDVRTGSGDDAIVMGTGSLVTHDIVSLGGGNDSVDFGRGVDQGDGGAGVDSLAADLGLATVAVSIDLVTNSFSGPANVGFVNFEYFGGSGFRTGSGNDIVVTGQLNRSDSVLLGAGADSATVYDGLDSVNGQSGSDLLIVDYSAATSAVTNVGGGGISLGSEGSGVRGSIGDGGTRRIDFDNVDRFDVRTGSGNDVVVFGSVSLSTNDIVSLGGGDDSVDFGAGTDVGDGGAGVDSLNADLNSATAAVSIDLVTNSFSGPAGTSFVNFEYFGGSGFQTGQGADTVVTGLLNRNDRVSLGSGNDSITLYDGQDSVFGGGADAGTADSGFDTLILEYGAATAAVHNIGGIATYAAGAFGQIGDDSTRLATFQAIDRFLITTGSGNDSIATGSGNDEIRTGAGTDSITAGAGNDLLDGGSGADLMTGGAGNDIYVVDNVGDLVVENGGEGTDEVRTALSSYVLAANVESLTATSDSSHDFRGNGGNNVVAGGGGNDVLRLYDGGDDTVYGGAGSDNIFFIGALTAADVVNGGEGTDTLVLQGPYGSLTLTANITQIENISILAGSNTNFGEPGTNRYDYVLTINDANFAAGVQARINGAALLAGEDFTFDGSAETDAKFVVYGGKGVDTLTGGLGNDIFFYAEERFATGDTVNGGAGYDGMFLRGNYTIDFNAPGYTGLFTNIENLTLTSATDERYARGGGTEFDYNLVLSDAIVKPGETLTVSGALLMTTETMILDASQESDGYLRLFGGRADDTLKGGALADLIHGNLGADQLTGNGGADTFRIDSTAESNSASMDHILDFTPGADKIDLSRVDANSLAAGDQAFAWIGSNAFSGTAGELRAFQQGGDWIVQGDTNGDGVADLVVALTLQGPAPLGAGDFLL